MACEEGSSLPYVAWGLQDDAALTDYMPDGPELLQIGLLWHKGESPGSPQFLWDFSTLSVLLVISLILPLFFAMYYAWFSPDPSEKTEREQSGLSRLVTLPIEMAEDAHQTVMETYVKKEEGIEEAKDEGKLASFLRTIPPIVEWFAVLIFGALGTWLRMYLSAGPPESKAFGTVSTDWVSNVFGTGLIAFMVGITAGSSNASKALHRGIVVGFCGGLTTFSAFIDESVKKQDGFLEAVVLTLAPAFGAYHLGWHAALVVRYEVRELWASERWTLMFEQACMSCLVVACLAFFLVSPSSFFGWRAADIRKDAATVVMGGVGSLCRFALAVLLNDPERSFFIGTFTANMTAVFILVILLRFAGPWWQVVIGTGFCGGLSTLSSLCNDFMVVIFRALSASADSKDSPSALMLMSYSYILITILVGAGICVMGLFETGAAPAL